MDFTVIGGLLTALLVAVPTVAAFFERQTRRVRKENRQLRALVQEADVHMFLLERRGFTERGERPPARPQLLRSRDDEDSDDGRAPAPAPRRPPDEPDSAGGGSRHSAP